jgi:hypothetical protein
MPEPVEFDWEQMLRQGFATGGLAGLTQAVQDVNAVSEQARTAHEQAVQVMSNMETQSRSVDQTTPRFVIPPDATSGDNSGVNGLMSPRLMGAPLAGDPSSAASPLLPFSSASGSAGAAGGGQENFQNGSVQGGSGFQGGSSGSVPGGFTGGGSPGGFTGGSGGQQPNFQQPNFGGGYQPAAASGGGNPYVPPNFQMPDGPQTGTSTSGYAPPTGPGYPGDSTYRPPGYQPPQNFQPPPGTGYPGGPGYVPGGPYNPGGRNNPGGQNNPYNPGGPFNPADPRSGGGYMPPRIDPLTGEPYKPGQGPRPMPFTGGGGGMPGGGGSGGGFGGAGSGGGFGGPRGAGGFVEPGGMRQPGFAAGAGAMAAEEAAMRGNQAPAAGRAGAAGSPGMGGGMGGGGARGEEDKEHRSKYATGEKIVEEPGRMVPLVIGEKKDRKQAEEK